MYDGVDTGAGAGLVARPREGVASAGGTMDVRGDARGVALCGRCRDGVAGVRNDVITAALTACGEGFGSELATRCRDRVATPEVTGCDALRRPGVAGVARFRAGDADAASGAVGAACGTRPAGRRSNEGVGVDARLRVPDAGAGVTALAPSGDDGPSTALCRDRVTGVAGVARFRAGDADAASGAVGAACGTRPAGRRSKEGVNARLRVDDAGAAR
jgi:hypothetical protein